MYLFICFFVADFVCKTTMIVYKFMKQIAAEEEENRVRQIQIEKQRRLLQFQQEVKKRVQHLDRLKKQKALEANYRAVCLYKINSLPHKLELEQP